MELYLKELIDVHKKNNNVYIYVDFRGETLLFNACDIKKYSEIEQRQIIERFFFKYIDLISDPILFEIILDHLYAGDYIFLSANTKSYLFETLELCPPKQYLSWIYKILDNEGEMSKINIQAFTTYVDMKRKRGLTNGEIRYTMVCESSTTLLELILSKVYRDRLTSKQTWLAIFRLKQALSMTSLQKDMFNEWLGVV
ncbi:unnamed protein product [Rotaria socialis]|uniref:Uncharacterized protein n=1 Tax=Rotaria socialis TaxID=392032 RepID=A0A817QHB2_9BILA|nr:unnamed protein product [Rotaria socialis]CAF3244167.1 unnamed protein product [Rotaria socialis]CAF3334367.1 unnamed protein product [Rotaria socialis]CAF3643456.1 unnamed protein product [Rotaria socialis]CAF3663542.1 unnamed protein product [Rotaria socialis]